MDFEILEHILEIQQIATGGAKFVSFQNYDVDMQRPVEENERIRSCSFERWHDPPC